MNVDSTGGEKFDIVTTYKVADSQAIDAMDPLAFSSGKVAQYNTIGIVPNTCIGFAGEAKTVTTLASEGIQKYVSVRRKGIMQFYGRIDGTYTSSISVGDRVSLYCDGAGSYTVVNNATNPIGEVVEGSMDTAGTTTKILVYVDVTTENITPGEFQWPFQVPTTSKIQFYDDGNYIHASADGKIAITADAGGADDITLSGGVTISGDLVVTGSTSIVSVGDTFTGTVQINDNANLQFEGISTDLDGMTVNCDSSGDSVINVTAGQLTLSTKDGVVKLVDSDAATDYITISTIAASSRQVIAAEPSGLFRFKDAGDANDSDVLDLDLTDAASANKLTSAVGFEIETTAGHITLDSAGDIYLDPAGNDVIFGVSAGKFTLGATSTTLYGGDSTGDDLAFYANSTDANPIVTLNGLGDVSVLIKDQDFEVQYDASNYLKVEVSSAGVATFTTVTATTDGMQFVTAVGNITLSSAGDIVLSATGADVTCDSQFTLTNTSADQMLIRYDASNHFGIDVDLDGSTTLTTTGTNADFEIASGTTGDITLDSTGDIILEAGGGDITADAQVTITNTSADQFVVAYDGSNYFKLDVANDGFATLSTTGTDADFEIATGTGGAITLDATAGIALESTGVTSDAAIVITNTSADQFQVLYDGSNYFKVDVDVDGSTTLTTVGTNADFEIVSGTTGDITLTATGDIYLAPTGADVIFGTSAGKITLAATSTTIYGGDSTGDDLFFFANSTDANPKVSLEGLGNITALIKDQDFVVSYDGSNYVKVEVGSAGETSITTVGSGDTLTLASDASITLNAGTDITLNPTGNDIIFGVSAGKITLGATSTTIYGGDTTGDDLFLFANSADATPKFSLEGLGNVTALILDQDFVVSYDGSNYVKTEVSSAGATTITAVGTNAPLTLVSGTTGAITLTATTDIALNPTGADVTFGGVAGGAGKITIAATSLTMYGGDTTGDDLVLQANSADTDNSRITINGAGAIEALIKDQEFRVEYDASNYLKAAVSSTGACTITTVGTGDTLTLVSDATINFTPGTTSTFTLAAAGGIIVDAGTTNHTGADVMSFNVDVNSASVNALSFDIDVDAAGALSSGETVNGISINIDGDNSDNAASAMNGIYLTSANTTTGVNSAINVAGTWDSVFVAGGAATNLILMGATPTYFVDFDACTGANGTICSQSGTVATSWAGRIKVQTPDGADGWVNVYSTSNEA